MVLWNNCVKLVRIALDSKQVGRLAHEQEPREGLARTPEGDRVGITSFTDRDGVLIGRAKTLIHHQEGSPLCTYLLGPGPQPLLVSG